MFKKLISNLPFNPSLINQVAFYAKRLHKEEKLRRLGVVMIVLSLFIQMFAIVSPPEPTLASGSDNDILRGGFKTQAEAVARCRANEDGFATILSAYYYTNGNLTEACDMLARAVPLKIRSDGPDGRKLQHSLGRIRQGETIARTGKPTNEYEVKIPGAGNGTFYMRNLWAWDSGPYSTYDVLAMQSKSGASILVLFNCGNIVTTTRVTPQPPTAPPPPPPPVTPGNAVCVSLTATPLTERKYRFKATTSGKDYTVKSYDFNFGNGQTKTVTSSSQTTSTEHTYDAANTYTASVKINVEVKGTSGTTPKTLECQVIVTTTKICDDATSDQDIEACLFLSKAARNNTQKLENAEEKHAQAADNITYTLRTKNNGKITAKNYVIEENISDILDYATVTDFHGGKLEAGNVVRWPAIDINSGQTVTKQLTISVKNPIPRTPSPNSDRSKFDLIMTNVYGNSVNIKLPDTILKTTEIVTTQTMPKTGPGETMVMGAIMIMVVSYFFARSRLLAKEMDIVQMDYVTSGSY